MYGPVSRIGGIRLAQPEPAYWIFSSDFTRTPVGNWFGGRPTGAAGASIDAEEAFIRCLGEIAERYSALTAPVEGRLLPIDRDLLAMFPVCSDDEDCPPELRGHFSDAPVTHVSTTRLADGANVDVPAPYVHLSPQKPDEPLLTIPISTGLAFDRSLEAALWRGICEVAERDALMLTWWQLRPAREIVIEPERDSNAGGASSGLGFRLNRIAEVSLQARFFDITTEFTVPTVVCVLTGDHFPFLTVGAACRDQAAAACAKALDEAVAIRIAVRGWEAFEPRSLDSFEWMNELEHHARLYAAGYLREAFEFLFDGGQPTTTLAEVDARSTIRVPRTLGELQALARDLDTMDLTVLWTDVTAPELSAQGHVVKVVIPQMIPLSQLHSARWLGTRRMRDRGVGGVSQASHFNRFPHPFA